MYCGGRGRSSGFGMKGSSGHAFPQAERGSSRSPVLSALWLTPVDEGVVVKPAGSRLFAASISVL